MTKTNTSADADCKTCGGSKIDPGGLPSCRDCIGAAPADPAFASAPVADGAWHWVIYETLAGERKWVPAQRVRNHWNSTSFSGIPLSEVSVGPAITMAAPAQDVAPTDAGCPLPPLGWNCTRAAGHDGPCAAMEAPEELALVAGCMDRLRASEQAEETLTLQIAGTIVRHLDQPLYQGRVMAAAREIAGYAAQPAAQPADAQQSRNNPAVDAINLLTRYRKLCVEIRRGDSHHIGRIDRAVAALVEQSSMAGTDRVWRDAVYQEARAVGTTIHMDSPARTLAEIMVWREQNAAKRADQATPDDITNLTEAASDFDDTGETSVDYPSLMHLAGLGLLECAHFHVTPEGRDAIDAARAQGAAA